MNKHLLKDEIFGLIRPDIDAHTLGVSAAGNLLKECGYRVITSDANLANAVANILKSNNSSLLIRWINSHKITRVGFSYRLDPQDAVVNFAQIYRLLKNEKMFREQGGRLNRIYFSGLPAACELIQKEYKDQVPVFVGDETQTETLQKLGVPKNKIPINITQGSKYDEDRLSFAQDLIHSGSYKYVKPLERFNYPSFGTFQDTLAARINDNRLKKGPPLMRVHVGPYRPDYEEAKKEFKSWLHELSRNGLLDIVSVGSSQLSQSDFGLDWENKPNGGGVPINSEQDLRDIWEAARPMLVRTYAGTRNIPELAKIYEKTINIAWHTFSFWWFNQIDGRGPYDVKENLRQHIDTLNIVAKSGKPFEPNIPHHFSFRGGDDYTYVLSSYLAAKAAKKAGVKYLVLQVMLNTPKYTWGVQDLAKARALLTLVRELEDSNFKVFLQPRAGLDYFSPDLEKAKIQLAAVSAMMDDIEPNNHRSPDIIHVVSYCEAVKLATPFYINESIQITIKSIEEYRKLKQAGHIDDMIENKEVRERTNDLYKNVKEMVKLIDKNIDNPYSADGLYEIFQIGVLVAPYLWEGRQEFKDAVKWNTNLVNGSVKIVDESNKPIDPVERVSEIFLKKSIEALK